MSTAPREKYTVLVPFPIGGGHWSSEGQELELLEVQAQALVTAGRLKLTSEVQAEAAAAAAAAEVAPTPKKSTAKAE
ncbi:hypothetical protein [Pseudomonas sp. yb_9]|uniref:hypothetical protein n=1 Tax=Pseudomonas sp. yb_9 TaxID=3367222 RepID=UPI00370CBB12